MNKAKSIGEIISLIKKNDTLAIPLATGQPVAFLNALSQRTDFERLEIFCGLLLAPYPILLNPNIYIKSGFYGPIERMLNEMGMHIEYLPASFSGLELYALKQKPRVVVTTLSLPDENGFCSFGTHGAAIYKPFLEACKNKDQLAIAEINPTMPLVYGHQNYGDNKIHLSEINYYFESHSPQPVAPFFDKSDAEEKIVKHVLGIIDDGATLQFGIGSLPDLMATKLAEGSMGDFGIHSELVSDGYLKLEKAGKISNKHKGVFKDQSVFTFAFGSQELYDFLDERKNSNKRKAICLPVGLVNDPHVISQNTNMVSINSGLMIDFAGQVCSEAIGLKQYSGVGGQLSFVQGAYEAFNGKTVICIKSAAQVNGKLQSNILPVLPPGSLVSTPRHYVQYIATEYGIVNLYGVSDEERGRLLIEIAHPQFRNELKAEYKKIKEVYYKNP